MEKHLFTSADWVEVARHWRATPRLGQGLSEVPRKVWSNSKHTVLRAMINLIPFGRIQLPFETIKKHIENLALTLVDGNRAMRIPKSGLA